MKDKKTVFLCTPHKLGDLNYELIKRIESLGFNVLCAVTHSPKNVPYNERFKKNVELIRKADIFIAVLKDYGKDLTAEVGMAYAWDMPRIGINYNAEEKDVMCYYALQKIIEPGQLEEVLSEMIALQ